MGCRHVHGEYYPLILEVWTIANGLKVVTSWGFYLIHVEFNSLTVLRLLKVEEVNFTVVRSFVEEILELNVG